MCTKAVQKSLQKFHLMPDYQSAYHENYSCETALVKTVYDMLWSMQGGKVMALMALDLLAACDTVNHSILLRALNLEWRAIVSCGLTHI